MTQIRALRKKSGFFKSDQKGLRKMMSKKLLRGKKERETLRSRGAVDIIPDRVCPVWRRGPF